VKLPLDENLSRRLVPRITDLYPDSSHVAGQSLLRASDRTIWEHAKAHGFAVVTADADSYELAVSRGAPPKVIWLRGCNDPTAVAEELLRSQFIRIAEFLVDPERVVLILKP